MSEKETKKLYVAPELVEFGSVAELTQRLGSGFENCGPEIHVFGNLGNGRGHGHEHNPHC